MGKRGKSNYSKQRKAPRIVPVKSYVRKGKIIGEHKRTSPDGIINNNHSSK